MITALLIGTGILSLAFAAVEVEDERYVSAVAWVVLSGCAFAGLAV